MSKLQRRIQPGQLRELVLIFLIIMMMVFFSTQIENYFSPRFFMSDLGSIRSLPVDSIL